MSIKDFKPTFRDLIYVVLILVSAVVFVRGNNVNTVANTAEIIIVKKDVANNTDSIESNTEEIQAQAKVDTDRNGELSRLKGDVQFISDVVESVARKVGAEIPMKKVTE